jgi:cysteine desulfurase
MPQFPVYLDHNATTPCDPRVVEAMLPYFTEKFGNAASRDHFFGWQAAEAVKLAREQVAALINADPTEIIFTSGATEADNLAIKGVIETYAAKGKHIISSNVEHKAVLDTCRHLEKQGAEVTYLEVNSNGLLDSSQLEAAIKPDTVLISVMYANNEIGTIMPMSSIGAIAKQKNLLLFSDAAQAVGKVPVDVNRDAVDLLAFSAHKLYGPKGIGALYIRRKNPRVKLTQQIDGGGHERGIRSGTLNVPGIVGFGKACEICMNEMETEARRLSKLRDKLQEGLLQTGGVQVNGDQDHRLPHVTNLSFSNIEGDALMMGINKTIAVSTGSACTSATPEPSHVLKALGLEDELVHSSLRFALGRFTTEEEISYTISKISETVNKLRENIFIK